MNDTFNLSPMSSDSGEIKFTRENMTAKLAEKQGSQDGSPKRIFDIKPKFKTGIDFTLKKNFSPSLRPFIKIKGMHQRKLTFDVAEMEDSESDGDFTSRINVLDPRSLKTESNRSSNSYDGDTSPFTTPSDGMFEKE